MDVNPNNERLKIRFKEHLAGALGRDDRTIIQYLRSLARFEKFTRCGNFGAFNKEQAIRFGSHLATSELALSTRESTLRHLRNFFVWLSDQPKFKRAISKYEVAYLRLRGNEVRASRAKGLSVVPTVSDVERVLKAMGSSTQVELRDRAILALLLLTGIRDGALVTLRLHHFDHDAELINQDPREVLTKGRKHIVSALLPVSEFARSIFLDYFARLRDWGFSGSDPLFPKTARTRDEDGGFSTGTLSREFWASAQPLRAALYNATVGTGVQIFNPHKVRNVLTQEMYTRKLPPDEFKAWSQNLGHERISTTIDSYGKLDVTQQLHLIRNGVGAPKHLTSNLESKFDEMVAMLHDLKSAVRK